MCTSMGREEEPAAGEAQVEDDPAWHPYCTECLLLSDPPRRWYGPSPFWELIDLDADENQKLIAAVIEALLAHRVQLRDLHHSHASLDANARHLIAELAVMAVLVVQRRNAQAESDAASLLGRTLAAEADHQRLLAGMRYMRALAHLFPHVNTDHDHLAIGVADTAPGAWCLACTVGQTIDELAGTDKELLRGDDKDWDERARQWVRQYEDRSKENRP